MRHDFEVVRNEPDRRRWDARTAGYIYELHRTNGQRIVRFHWHQSSSSQAAAPHVHVDGAIQSVSLRGVHLPTGHVSLHAVLRMAIRELEVEPLRNDWESLLDEPTV